VDGYGRLSSAVVGYARLRTAGIGDFLRDIERAGIRTSLIAIGAFLIHSGLI
jgi:hypothetical protein